MCGQDNGQIYRRPTALRAFCLGGSALLALSYFVMAARAQVQLPEVVISGAKPKPKPKPAPRRVVARPAPAAPAAPVNPVATQTATLDQGRNTIYAPLGTAPATISHATIEALPQGTNTTIEKVVLQ